MVFIYLGQKINLKNFKTYCFIEILKKHKNILKYNHGERSIKVILPAKTN